MLSIGDVMLPASGASRRARDLAVEACAEGVQQSRDAQNLVNHGTHRNDDELATSVARPSWLGPDQDAGEGESRDRRRNHHMILTLRPVMC
ncbi:hypothetical protein [Couchioplanes caeruleus]|uniref:Uncharacterized protein n=2 Tax=Couchioplanes caeruleus TaxID=56438 RepID=A0A1K0GIU3_9ACTN|nr:hypothetical protein [Couchioplanes caeruleus]OJF12174.1 hypothetical protein BG844_22065 [Couchioplanes caeruleus subsp. caeruleus]ROP28251.1 hypothetical protein EDD30_0984 [Couchioplanes caeruleus]